MTTKGPTLSTGYPRVVARRQTPLSAWVSVIEKEICFRAGEAPQVYHSLTQAPSVAVMAIMRDGRVPLVRQYRPAVERHTWEFPAGTVDADEAPAVAAARELLEETGLRAVELRELGTYDPDTGRLSVSSTGYFALCSDDVGSPEEGLELCYVSVERLFEMVRSGEFRHQLHIALIASALIRGFVPLPA